MWFRADPDEVIRLWTDDNLCKLTTVKWLEPGDLANRGAILLNFADSLLIQKLLTPHTHIHPPRVRAPRRQIVNVIRNEMLRPEITRGKFGGFYVRVNFKFRGVKKLPLLRQTENKMTEG